MRPLKLTMQAFGPYATKQEVDFTKLGEKTMFVISGPTGAGKTTIFDGISFAIYGKASGDDRSGADLRSQFTQDDTLTEVSLLFELRSKRYFIIRSPQQEKKKARGEGMTTINSKAELYELYEGKKHLLAGNVREVDEKVSEIIKLDCHQFRQIMMIPQGEFKKLLISESKDKEKILQKLFHTEHYKGIEERLREKAAQLRKQVERSIVERNSFISRILCEGNDTLQQLKEKDYIHIADLLGELQKVICEDEQVLKEYATTISGKEHERQLVEKNIHFGNTIIEQMELKECLLQQKEELEDRKPSIDKMVEAVQLANKAAIVHQYEDKCVDVSRQLVLKEQELINANTLISNLTTVLKNQQEELLKEEEKATEREHLQQQLAKLQHIEKDVLIFTTIEKEVQQLQKTLEKLKETKVQHEEQLRVIEEQLSTLVKEKEAINEAKLKKSELAIKLTNEERMLERITQLLQKKKQLISLENTFSDTEDDRADLEEDVKEVSEELEALLDAWNKGQAGLLAQSLAEDHPCPVCGSTHHPNKAASHGEMPTEQQLKDVRNKLKGIEEEKQKVDALYFEAKSKFEAHMDQVIKLADDVSIHMPHQYRSFALEDLEEHYERQCTMLKAEVKELEEQVKNLSSIEIAIEELTRKVAAEKQQLAKCIEDHESVYTSYVEKRRDHSRLIETLPSDLRDEKAFVREMKNTQDRLFTLEKALQMVQQAVLKTTKEMAAVEGSISSIQKGVTELKERQKEFQQMFRDKLTELGFASIEHYSRVKLPEIEVRKLEATIQAYREEFRSVTDRYLDLVTRLEEVKKPDMTQLNEKLRAINEELTLLQEKRNIIYHKVKTNNNVFETVTAISKEMATVEAEYKTVGELADIASGKNTYRITFERFVLAAFLDDILVAANARLSRMTNGRYQLERKTERSKGTAQSGLELLAFDQYTGASRHVKTLSGGESFKASLALALGLADIVQSYSGGVSMETMFIDEGFGTLDPESLENAIETLIDIQSTGRLVGIISHVPELKERIDARFEVTATQVGSVVSYYGDTVSM